MCGQLLGISAVIVTQSSLWLDDEGFASLSPFCVRQANVGSDQIELIGARDISLVYCQAQAQISSLQVKLHRVWPIILASDHDG